jgi:Zn finger protein HypA/HybF involved in hydrogenase expression
MRRIESDCVSCDMPCIRHGCPYYEVEHFYCDECGEETTLYEWDGRELCIDCIRKELDVVEGSDIYEY